MIKTKLQEYFFFQIIARMIFSRKVFFLATLHKYFLPEYIFTKVVNIIVLSDCVLPQLRKSFCLHESIEVDK